MPAQIRKRLEEMDAAFTARLRIAESDGLLKKVCALLAHSGDSWFWFAALGVVWAFGGAEWRGRALALIVSIFGTAVVVTALKFTIRRPRPAGEWGTVYRITDPHSFPSGHAARAILLAVMGWHLGPVWFAAALTVWAPLVSAARIAMGVHYASDVLAGWVVGALMAAVFVAVF